MTPGPVVEPVPALDAPSRSVPAGPEIVTEEVQKPSLVPSAEPTPLYAPGKAPVRTRTYFTPRNAESFYPAGYGIHIGVSQKFLDELVKVESRDAGPVRDCILGAQVVGSQTTETAVHVRLVPNSEKAELEFQLSGVTRNVTENRTPQAIIQSEGLHRFEVSKSVQFDGKRLLTRSPSAVMYPNHRNRSATTAASSIPILGPLVSQYALSMADQRRPLAERIAAQKISDQVAPQFNNSIDERLSTVNSQLREVVPKQMLVLGIAEPTTRARTTDKQMTFSFAWDTVQNCPEYVPNVAVADASELRVAVHGEAVKIWLSSLPLGGVEIPVDDLDHWGTELKRSLSYKLWGDSRFGESIGEGAPALATRTQRLKVRTIADNGKTPPRFGEPTILGPLLVPPAGTGGANGAGTGGAGTLKVPVIREKQPLPQNPEPTITSEPTTEQGTGTLGPAQTHMILAKENPLTVDFESGEAIITLTVAFRIGPAPQTGFHRIRVPLTSEIRGDELIVTPGTVKVESVDSTGPLTELMRSTIEKQVQQRLQPTSWPVERTINREKAGPLVIRLHELSSGSGWLSLVWGVKESSGPSL